MSQAGGIFDAFIGVKSQLSEAEARIAELEEALRKIQPLLRGTVDSHSDPHDSDYNECESIPCNWCKIALEVLGHD